MTLKGWLDIHGHFYLPQTAEERSQQLQSMRDNAFLVSTDWIWTPENSLAYMDQASVQMQMLSYLPPTLDKLKKANNYAADLVRKYPARFGQLAAIPTDNVDDALAEIERARTELHSDGFAVSTRYNNVPLSDDSLHPVWQRLHDLKATLFVHPNAYAPPVDGRSTALIEVAFDTARVATDLLYKGFLRRYTDVKIVLAHCGGALPALSGRLALLGTQSWVPNPEKITREEVKQQLGRLYVDTAATAETGLQPACKMVGKGHVVYGADCGVPCSDASTMEENRMALKSAADELGFSADEVGMNAWTLFPSAAARVEGLGNRANTNGKS